MLNWIIKNWTFSIPIGVFVVYLVCYGIEQAVYSSLGIPAARAPHKKRFPATILFLEGLAVFFFLMWYNCGMIFWEKGWRPALLVLFFVSLVLLAAVWGRTFRRLTRRSPNGARVIRLRRRCASVSAGRWAALCPVGL